MRNAEVRTMQVAGNNALVEVLKKARLEEKKDQHLAFSLRLAALSIHAQKKELSTAEVIELLRKEAERFEHSSQEIIV
ncbi:DUF2732 domain-containing protein [Pectobacterium brasiliense]|uniref:DUF2732 family protein n=1 Tax=Pectobacterium brasiliense TaxID=180957 RepID=UPI0019697763|nr:DUF2732 family protein [Pectobacterium brasiliense]MBN3207520.1 DUF2732 domain-containing protein [Pectobacterium brasiliense]MCA5919204.1 DUF2732 domain-containing protein [Pectobacterium brasiliense]MCA5926409.1 DUF2732 domain-containing protein [Pectobacterium brasiliense]MCA5935575.1 DUF2732 domain-containing protein [Pectobacterium brasiliense]MCA5941506.1 DUF2732 domain-containing protein [Pectobacterium brasiliense]